MPLGSNWPRLGNMNICHRLIKEKYEKIFSQAIRPKACILSMLQCYVVLYNPVMQPIMPKGTIRAMPQGRGHKLPYKSSYPDQVNVYSRIGPLIRKKAILID